MFKSLKFYIGATLDFGRLNSILAEFGYKRQEAVLNEGDFSRRGNLLDVFAFTFELPIRVEFSEDTITSIRTFDPAKGSILWDHQMVIVLPVKKVSAARSVSFSEQFPLENFVDIQIGDYVVHNEHGVGRFKGIERIKVGDKAKDHLVIEYDGGEKLFVPVESMHLVQKYIAFHVRRPKLHRLGSKEWQRIKQRARKGIEKLAWDLLSLQALRVSSVRDAFSPDTDWQHDFEKTFPYQETPDQVTTCGQVRADMETSRPMDRLICGDVGYGKTEVAMRAAFKAVMDDKQVAYLVPTTILAEQHFQNFSRRLKDFPVIVEMLSRFRTQSQQKAIVGRISQGSVDIVIGTHRLLSDDVRFKDLGLVIIDEEQRFGVKAKEKLKAIRLTTDVITLTATPIPRTLYMSLMGARDMSVINTPPENRLPITTIVVEYDDDILRQALTRELNRKGQVFILHNRIEDIGKLLEKIKRLVPAQTRIRVGHGRMPSSVLEEVMADFLQGKIDILLCTMIIESGIDIPNANTIIVNNAHTFGLSDLHQLRGRVGRFDRSAYAYFVIPRAASISTIAAKRLQALQEYSQLGAGFRIAMEDLEIRGAGNLLGSEQHGFINAVGFDLYCRLLKEAIATFKKIT
ncbi:MAG: transcription-repair coupling factor [Candidatus Omnitrophota bacterium]